MGQLSKIKYALCFVNIYSLLLNNSQQEFSQTSTTICQNDSSAIVNVNMVWKSNIFNHADPSRLVTHKLYGAEKWLPYYLWFYSILELAPAVESRRTREMITEKRQTSTGQCDARSRPRRLRRKLRLSRIRPVPMEPVFQARRPLSQGTYGGCRSRFSPTLNRVGGAGRSGRRAPATGRPIGNQCPTAR